MNVYTIVCEECGNVYSSFSNEPGQCPVCDERRQARSRRAAIAGGIAAGFGIVAWLLGQRWRRQRRPWSDTGSDA